MKITINVEATAQEMREFLGLPNVQPIQDEMLERMREQVRKGVAGLDPALLMQPMQSVEAMQRLFWDALTKGGKSGAAGDQDKGKG